MGLALLGLAQTRARAWSCAPPPAGGRSAGDRWQGGRTVHNKTARERRLRSAVRGDGRPWRTVGWSRQGGGWQSGAAGEMPPGSECPARRREDDWRNRTTDDRPARVAMGGMDSYTAGPDRTAARHTDARSLAVPVSRGTLFPTAPPDESGVASCFKPDPEIRNRFRKPTPEVYAVGKRPRIFFQRSSVIARRVPNDACCQRQPSGTGFRRGTWPSPRCVHGRIDNGG